MTDIEEIIHTQMSALVLQITGTSCGAISLGGCPGSDILFLVITDAGWGSTVQIRDQELVIVPV